MDLTASTALSPPLLPPATQAGAKLERAQLARLQVERLQSEIDRLQTLMAGAEPRPELALELLRVRVQWDTAHLHWRHAVAAAREALHE